MKISVVNLAVLIGLLFCPIAIQGETIVITGAKVLDAKGERFLDDHAVLISDGVIKKVSGLSHLKLDGSETRLDLTGLYLIPGLIDLHSHLLLHPYDEASWTDQVLKEPLALRTVRGVAAARATLDAGFTTLRDLGTEGAAYADVGIRDAIAQGIVPGPRLLVATRAIVATGCYGPSGFDPRWAMPVGAQVADGVAEVRKVVRQQIAAGADWIKVYADYRRKPGDASTPTFSQEELNAIVDEANSAGLPVSAHATTNKAIRRAVLAGVATIEHGTQASTESLTLMRQHGVALCPTLAAGEAVARYAGWDGEDPAPKRVADAKAMFKRALQTSVIIACGSDVGVFPHGDNARELELMIDYGMSPARALRSATIIAAKVLSKEDELGQIAEGFLADLIAVKGNPLREAAPYRNVMLVIKGGEVVADHR